MHAGAMQAFCKAVHFLVGSSLRAINGHDPIPSLPEKSWCAAQPHPVLAVCRSIDAQIQNPACRGYRDYQHEAALHQGKVLPGSRPLRCTMFPMPHHHTLYSHFKYAPPPSMHAAGQACALSCKEHMYACAGRCALWCPLTLAWSCGMTPICCLGRSLLGC